MANPWITALASPSNSDCKYVNLLVTGILTSCTNALYLSQNDCQYVKTPLNLGSSNLGSFTELFTEPPLKVEPKSVAASSL